MHILGLKIPLTGARWLPNTDVESVQSLMERILLTGATGFVGPTVARTLHSAGHQVRAAGRRTPDHRLGLVGWTSVPTQDACTDWSQALYGNDVVVHLAGLAHASSRKSDAAARMRTVNVQGTQALAEQAAAAGVRRFVFLSSLKVHGEESAARPHRATDALHPADPYGKSKAEAEHRLREISAATGMSLVIIRAPLLIGPGSKANLAKLIQLVRNGVPLPFASVRNQRSVLSLANLADLIALCITHPRATEQPLLAADADAPSTPQLIRWVAEAVRRPARLVPFAPRLLELIAAPLGMEPAIRRLTRSQMLDATPTSELTGWHPKLSTLETLKSACQQHQPA
jgi:UDP-4-keto-D-QuiNAc 4-reductase